MYCQDDYFKIFGRISVLFATLDLAVTELIIKLSKVEDNLSIPWENATLGKKISILSDANLQSDYGKNIKNLLQASLPEAKEIAEERNRYIHDQWIFKEETIRHGRIDRIRLSSSGLKERSTLTISDIVNFQSRVGAIQEPFFIALNHPG